MRSFSICGTVRHRNKEVEHLAPRHKSNNNKLPRIYSNCNHALDAHNEMRVRSVCWSSVLHAGRTRVCGRWEAIVTPLSSSLEWPFTHIHTQTTELLLLLLLHRAAHCPLWFIFEGRVLNKCVCDHLSVTLTLHSLTQRLQKPYSWVHLVYLSY